MLSAPDRRVVAADPGLPGLGVLLDSERLRALLDQSELGAVHGAVVTHYVRYKPGTRCVAACHLRNGEESIPIHVVAHGRDAATKLEKQIARRNSPTLLGPGAVVFPGLGLSVSVFPNDSRLPSLARIGSASSRRELLQRVFPRRPGLWDGELSPLAYKPERRFVAGLDVDGERKALLKFLTPGDFWTARRAPDYFVTDSRIAGRIGQSKKHGVLALEWLEGRLLRDDLLASPDPRVLELCGAALASLHAGPAPDFDFQQKAELDRLPAVAATLGRLLPGLASRAARLAERVAVAISNRPARRAPIHGDFYSKQVVINGSEIGLLDFDRAGAGDPAIDIGLFRAHTERDVIRGDITRSRCERIIAGLEQGYADVSAPPDDTLASLWTVAGLLAISIHHFRNREPDWDARTESTLARAEQIFGSCRLPSIADSGQGPKPSLPHEGVSVRGRPQLDPTLPFLEEALDPRSVTRQLREAEAGSDLRIVRASLLRHKRGRRALIRYDADQGGTSTTLVAKLRARDTDRDSFETSRALWAAGFDSASRTGFSTPEAIAMLPEIHMCLYRFVEAVPSTELFCRRKEPLLARRVAELAHELHSLDLPAARQHDMGAELCILRERFAQLSLERGSLQPRLQRLMAACERLGASIPVPVARGIHRDFYPDQVLVQSDRARVQGPRLFLVDLDLYCQGDPALDIGNFQAHLCELALRELGDPLALHDCEQEIEQCYLDLSHGVSRAAIRAYRLLTLARHVSISSQFSERRHLTDELLSLCESEFRLGALR